MATNRWWLTGAVCVVVCGGVARGDESEPTAGATPSAAADPFADDSVAEDSVAEDSGDPFTDDGPDQEERSAPVRARVWACAHPDDVEAIYAQLRDATVSMDLREGTPLEEAVAQLQEACGAPIVIDTKALDEYGLGADEPVSLHVEQARLADAMKRLLSPLGLAYCVRGGAILVTGEDDVAASPPTAVYDVRDLLLKGDYESLLDTITSTVAADTWALNGRGDGEIRPYWQRGALVISQSGEVHEEVLALLSALRRLEEDPTAKEPRTVLGAAGGSLPSGGGGGGFGFGFGSGAFSVRPAVGGVSE